MKEEEIIVRHAKILEKAILLIQDRIDLLTPKAVKQPLSDSESATRVYQVRSLKVYKRFLNYIVRELKKNDPEAAFFLIPQVRTLIDIYAKFLHLQLNAYDLQERALICIANQLLATVAADSEDEFNKTKQVYKKVIEGTLLSDIQFTEYSFRWLQKNNFHFFPRDRLLTEENVNRFAVNSKELFKGKQLHRLYSAFSEFNHGNPFYGSNEPHNERYWVITMAIQMTAYIIELIDREILRKPQKADFRLWLKEINAGKDDLLAAWNQSRGNLERRR